MKFSAPIYILKQQAKAISKRDNVRLHIALDQIAVREGFNAWSHLSSNWRQQDTSNLIYQQLHPGDLMLIGARPGQGKTLLGIGLAVEAMTQGNQAALFTFEYTPREVAERLNTIGKDIREFQDRFLLDTSEDISSRYIAQRLAAVRPHALVVVDYLQLLDQRRDKPALDVQVRELKEFAGAKHAMVVCLSQISRDYVVTDNSYPELRDVRLPNYADLSLFNKACFLNNGKMQLHSSR